MCLGHITQLVFIEVKRTENISIWFMIFQSKNQDLLKKTEKKVLMRMIIGCKSFQ